MYVKICLNSGGSMRSARRSDSSMALLVVIFTGLVPGALCRLDATTTVPSLLHNLVSQMTIWSISVSGATYDFGE